MNELESLIEKQKKELREKDKRFTCDDSSLSRGESRLYCYKSGTTRVGGFCNSCPDYKNKELGIGYSEKDELNYGLSPIQKRYLLEINSMVVTHTREDNPNYKVAQELEKKGLIKLIKSDGPFILTTLSDAGRAHIKLKIIGGQNARIL